ncbi:MAG: hypothetical protein PWP24_1460 [Clostridiales bacterium]|nr:hypothetical protein [Clostridiales bacterium]
MRKLYYVEDDSMIAEAVKQYLFHKGYELIVFESIQQAKREINRNVPSLVLVDWNLLDGSGYHLCKWIRETWKELPIIFLTVKGDSKDIILGLQAGADDYLVKPFDLDVLYARISAVLRRTGNLAEKFLTCGEITIDKTKHIVYQSKEEVVLSPIEYQLNQITHTA